MHTAVLLPQVLAALNVRASGTYVDATFGRGGHAGAILEKLIADGRLLCLDRDPRRHRRSQSALRRRSARCDIPRAVLRARLHAPTRCSPACNSTAFCSISASPLRSSTTPARGFSFMHDGPLDMRMSAGEGMSAADVVNGASEAELIRIFREFGEERQAPRIARAIVADRRSRPFERTLAARRPDRARRPRPARRGGGRARHKHPATRVFQALRIHVNRELERAASPRSKRRSSAWRRTVGSPSSVFTRSRIAW